MPTDITHYIGALTLAVDGEGGRRNIEFLGTAFSLSQPYRLFMSASHVLPDHIEPPARLAITLRQDENLHTFLIQEHEVLRGNDAVVVLRPEEGVEHMFGLAPREASILEDVYGIGIPDALVERSERGMVLRLRGLHGIVTRRLEIGDQVAGKTLASPSYEIDCAIPEGMSGAPVFATSMGRDTDLVGLLGVCVGSHYSETTLWSEESEMGGLSRGMRVTQFGLVARLFPQYSTIIELVGLPLDVVVGPAPGRTTTSV